MEERKLSLECWLSMKCDRRRWLHWAFSLLANRMPGKGLKSVCNKLEDAGRFHTSRSWKGRFSQSSRFPLSFSVLEGLMYPRLVSNYEAKDDLDLLNFLLPPLEFWDYRCVLQCLVYVCWGLNPKASCVLGWHTPSDLHPRAISDVHFHLLAWVLGPAGTSASRDTGLERAEAADTKVIGQSPSKSPRA